MTNAGFRAFCDSLVGTWVGHRRTADLEHELVHSRWRKALDGRFLQEDWCTAGGGSAPEPTAQAFFGISGAGPRDFIAVYSSGKIAFGESTFVDSEWRLTHRWLREPGVAAIRLKLIDGGHLRAGGGRGHARRHPHPQAPAGRAGPQARCPREGVAAGLRTGRGRARLSIDANVTLDFHG